MKRISLKEVLPRYYQLSIDEKKLYMPYSRLEELADEIQKVVKNRRALTARLFCLYQIHIFPKNLCNLL